MEENSAATQQMSASAEEMSAQVQEVVASSKSLSNLAEELKTAVMAFKLNNENSMASVRTIAEKPQIKNNGKKTRAEIKDTITV